MEDKKKNEEDAASQLIENLGCAGDSGECGNAETAAGGEAADDENRIFRKYKIKDIVFLAIITACTMVTGAVMPLLVNVPLFGIIQLGLGLQFSIFPVIGMMKVKKAGALLFQSVFISCFLVFMFPPMVLIIACAFVAEAVAIIIFRGYKNDWACVVAGTLYMPLTVPLFYLYYNVFYTVTGEERQAVAMFLGGSDPLIVVGITVAIVALCFLGSVLGMKISRELKKAGVLKK